MGGRETCCATKWDPAGATPCMPDFVAAANGLIVLIAMEEGTCEVAKTLGISFIVRGEDGSFDSRGSMVWVDGLWWGSPCLPCGLGVTGANLGRFGTPDPAPRSCFKVVTLSSCSIVNLCDGCWELVSPCKPSLTPTSAPLLLLGVTNIASQQLVFGCRRLKSSEFKDGSRGCAAQRS